MNGYFYHGIESYADSEGETLKLMMASYLKLFKMSEIMGIPIYDSGVKNFTDDLDSKLKKSNKNIF